MWRAIELSALGPKLPSSGNVLDIGCGDGHVTRILREAARARWRLVGVDADPHETKLAEQAGIYDRVHTAPANAVPEEDGAFDLAIANSVLEHICELPSALGEISRCLAPGGLLAATVPSVEFHELLAGPAKFSRRTRAAYLADIDRRLAHVNYWSRQRWREELSRAGFGAPAITGYLSLRQLRRWETWSNWTGGMLYRSFGRQRSPIAIQRSLGLRRRFPRALGLLAFKAAWAATARILDERASDDEPTACCLILVRKRLI
ncbi:MAG TPA: class I SAM-dependent methyltransferase [Pirellulales bacterium]|nr:class I SAM-dependent methyltransferase [Pirellulales bacterium]